MNDVDSQVEQVHAIAVRKLLEMRNSAGHWEGCLSSSALSTATALFALSLFNRHTHSDDSERPQREELIAAGIRWLLANQNADGGWGDTTVSYSNISTTALCWAALSVAPGGLTTIAISAAEAWLVRAAGSLSPESLAKAITARYEKDRTFSVPILTMCALAARLGESPAAWRLIPQLPFEHAALPQSWFRFVRLPVVSYALPALISMGLARHRMRPTRNPLARLIRRCVGRRVLKVLRNVQPRGGGFLEATPLTSFVVMSLIASGEANHAVVHEGVRFLTRFARPDGSWPIDTNLTTWVTTLSVNALAAGGGAAAVAEHLNAGERTAIREWLLAQQYRVRHPYTGAPPGGWAWTDLPGGVPDSDDTAGALLALRNLFDIDERVVAAGELGITWLLNLQNSDGGIPTFCRGWTNLPFDRSGADLTAHALQAWHAWRGSINPQLVRRVDTATKRALRYLKASQSPDGSWSPLWFGNQDEPNEENRVYGTAKVILALGVIRHESNCCTRAIEWLLKEQNGDGGWGSKTAGASSIEETGLALDALASVSSGGSQFLSDAMLRTSRAGISRAIAWMSSMLDRGSDFNPSPIGFYFAKLWYFERTYPAVFATGSLLRLRTNLGA